MKKTYVSIRVDREIIEWFRANSQGYKDYVAHINAVLKDYMKAHQSS